jgi:hypothetical protein
MKIFLQQVGATLALSFSATSPAGEVAPTYFSVSQQRLPQRTLCQLTFLSNGSPSTLLFFSFNFYWHPGYFNLFYYRRSLVNVKMF